MANNVHIYNNNIMKDNNVHIYNNKIMRDNNVHIYTNNIMRDNNVHIYNNNIMRDNNVHIYNNSTHSSLCVKEIVNCTDYQRKTTTNTSYINQHYKRNILVISITFQSM